MLVLVLSFALGPNVGRHFGSITLYFVIVGLAIAGVGYLRPLPQRDRRAVR